MSSDDEIFQDILTDSRTGLVIGGFVMMPLSDTLAIQPEVLWVQKGASGTSEGANLTFQLDYLEIPILANFRFSPENRIRPFVFTGPVPAFTTAATIRTLMASLIISMGRARRTCGLTPARTEFGIRVAPCWCPRTDRRRHSKSQATAATRCRPRE